MKTYTENIKYCECKNINIGYDFCQWKFRNKEEEGYIYFEEDEEGNRNETYHKKEKDAIRDFEVAKMYFGEKNDNRD